MKFFLRLAFLCASILFLPSIKGQISSTGKTFYFSFMEMEARSGGYPDSLLVYITSEVNTTITIDNPRIAGSTQTMNITAGKVNRYNADPGFYYPQGFEKLSSDIESKRSLRIVAKDPINVYTLNLEQNRSDGTFVLPYESIPPAPEFYVAAFTPTQRPGSSYMPSEFVVVGMDNSVEVEITPTTKLASGKAAGTPFTVTLTRGQVFQVQSDRADGNTGGNDTKGDLTGTRVRVIKGCGKINVFSGMRSVKIPSASCGIAVDHLYTQVFPSNILGKKHVLTPFKDQSKGYVYRVVAVKPNTKIYVNGTLVSTKNAGQWYQADVTTNTATCVTSDSNIMVVQYMKNGGTCAGTTGNNGDPAILIMPDYSQKMLKSVVGTATTNNMTRHYVNIMVNSNATKAVKLNGTFLSSTSFTDVPCAGQSFIQVQVANPSTNTIECDSGFIAVVYGMGQYESYSYCSGALFENLEYDFSITRNGKCPGELVKLKALTTNPKIKSIHWDYGDKTPRDTGRNASHKFQRVGSFFVVMRVAVPGACGGTDTITRSKIIDILPGPVYDMPDTAFQCADTLNYKFTGPVKTSFFYKWQDSSKLNTYTARAQGKVWVRIYDSATRCAITDSTFVFRYNKLAPAFKSDTADKCLPTNFFSLSDDTKFNGDSYKSASWKITRTYIQSVSKRDTFSTLDRFRINFDTTGIFPVKYLVTSKKGCVDSVTGSVGVYTMPTAVYYSGKSEYCQKAPALFRDSSFGEGGIAKTFWTFGDGNNGTGLTTNHSYAGYDTFFVRMITETVHGCRDTADSSIIIHPLPVMSMSSTINNVCKKANSFDFKDNSTVAYGTISNTWKYEKQTVTGQPSLTNIKFSDTGNYRVRLYNQTDKGCIDSTSKSVYVAPEPRAIIATTDSSRCFDVHYYSMNDASTITKGSITSRRWSFSDGTSATTASVLKKKFSAYGTYTVKLVITSGTYACKDSVSRNLIVFASPEAPFDVNDSVQCNVNNKFDFTPKKAFNVTGVTATHDWTYGDGGTDNTATASHSYSGLGKFNVRYIIKTSQGCADTATRVIDVKEAPKADFTISKDSSCLGTYKYDFVNLTNFGTFNSKWKLDDGSTAVTKDVLQKAYANAGTYNITLVVTSPTGCADSTLRRVFVLPVPNAAFTVNNKNQCFTGNSFVFTNTTATNGASPMVYNWNFSNGNNFNTQNISAQSMTDTGWYTITLDAKSAFGCASSFNDKVYVAETPTVSFTAGTACAKNPIPFNATAAVNTGSIAGYAWNFGDGGNSTLEDPTYTYNNANSYNVTLTVTSNRGCVATAGPVPVDVYANPIANFSHIQTETRGMDTDHELTFTGSGAAQYLWTFHDGQTSTSGGPVKVTFSEQGQRPVTLLVKTANGCRDSITKSITLNPELQMWIANTFSPNDDGLNEGFGPSTTFGLSNYSMKIYDRWGAKMFESKDPAKRWMGADDAGDPAPEGIYAYHIVFRYVDGKIFVYRGTVTVLR